MTAFNLNFNKSVEATLLEDDQKVKTETGNELSNEKTVTDMDKSAKSQDFFQDNNAIKVKYTATRIKSRNFLIKYRICRNE